MAFLGIGVANSVSLFRMGLCFVVVALLYSATSTDYTTAFALTLAIIWMDGLDGYLARKLGESSPLGAVIDILSDRVVEQIYWITFAVLGWIPLWMPLVVVMRGVWVDGLRGLALQQGYTAFGSTSMMQTWWGVLLVSSRFSRWTYAATKALAFSVMILAHQPADDVAWASTLTWLKPFANACAWIAIVFCVVRGLPVLIESRHFMHASTLKEKTV